MKKRAFTLVETVIAVALVVIVATLALTTIFTSISNTQKQHIYKYTYTECNNIIVIFQSDDFESGLQFFYDDENITITDNKVTLNFDANGKYLSDSDGIFSICCEVEESDKSSTLNITASTEDNTLYETSYTKKA